MERLNLSSDNVRTCEETNMFVKECKNIVKCQKKGILNLAYKQRFVFEKLKRDVKRCIKKCSKQNLQKSVKKVSKTQSVL